MIYSVCKQLQDKVIVEICKDGAVIQHNEIPFPDSQNGETNGGKKITLTRVGDSTADTVEATRLGEAKFEHIVENEEEKISMKLHFAGEIKEFLAENVIREIKASLPGTIDGMIDKFMKRALDANCTPFTFFSVEYSENRRSFSFYLADAGAEVSVLLKTLTVENLQDTYIRVVRFDLDKICREVEDENDDKH